MSEDGYLEITFMNGDVVRFNFADHELTHCQNEQVFPGMYKVLLKGDCYHLFPLVNIRNVTVKMNSSPSEKVMERNRRTALGEFDT